MKVFTLLAVTSLITTPALAADFIIQNEVAPARVDTFSWAGGYIGLNAGYAWGKSPTVLDWYTGGDEGEGPNVNMQSMNASSSALSESYHYDQNLSGFIGGIQAGYNWQFDKIVAGIETDIQGASLKKSTILLDNNDAKLETKINWLGTTRVRLGYLPTERLLAYVTGGVAYGGVKASLTDYYGFDTSTSKTKAGYAIGAGLEYALADNWTVKGEYLYANLGKISHQVYSSDSNDFDIATHKFRMHTVRVGVNYKF